RVAGRAIADFRIGPDGSRVVYRLQQGPGERTLCSVTIDGSSRPVELNGQAQGASNASFDYAITPDSGRVVFLDAGTQRLFSAPLDGSAPPVQLSTNLRAGGYVFRFVLGPGGGRVPFAAATEAGSPLHLYSAPVAGGASADPRARRSPPEPRRLDMQVQAGDVYNLLASSRGRIVYQLLAGGDDLYSV